MTCTSADNKFGSCQVPVINKKEEIFSTLCDFNVSMSRATWFIKMTNAFNTAVSEAKANKRMRFDPSIGESQTPALGKAWSGKMTLSNCGE